MSGSPSVFALSVIEILIFARYPHIYPSLACSEILALFYLFGVERLRRLDTH